MLRIVDWRRYGNDVNATSGQLAGIGGETQLVGTFHLAGVNLQGCVPASRQRGDSGLVYIEAQRGVLPAERHGQGQAHVTQADNADPFVRLSAHDPGP